MYVLKALGVILIVLSTTTAGICYNNLQKRKIQICDELISFCDSMLVELSYSLKPVYKLIDEMNIDYITMDNLTNSIPIESPLSNKENDQISSFLFSLGKSDAKSQIKVVTSFKEYVNTVRGKYVEGYKSKSRICLSLGVYSGVIISLILI